MALVEEEKCDYSKDVDQVSSDSSSAPQDEAGSIGVFDFYIWTAIPAIGIIFCFIHTEQERFWTWEGETASAAQSFQSKVVVSVVSTIIGGCVLATLMKTIASISYTTIRYRGAHFSHLVTIIGGHSPGHIPMLIAGKMWRSIILIVLILIISAVTKQLAVVSMGVEYVSGNAGSNTYATRNYSTCVATNNTGSIGHSFQILALDAFNSLRNPNFTYTNEYYDRSIPANLLGEAEFMREMPYSTVSCELVKAKSTFSRIQPIMTDIPSTINHKYGSPWAGSLTIPYHDDYNADVPKNFVNCSIYLGHATSLTSCNNTYCKTSRITNVTRYEDDTYNGGMLALFEKIIIATQPGGSLYRNLLMTWISGGSLTDLYAGDRYITGESLEVIETRLEILGTVSARILCDFNNADETVDQVLRYTTFQSHLLYHYFVYHILWKWPFWMLSGFVFVFWFISMVAMRITPESRVISVEWLLSQYILRERLGYLSGGPLVKAHEGSVFQVIDLKADVEVGNIAISEIKSHKYEANINVLHDRNYQ